MTRIRRVLCSFLIHYLICFFSVAATGPEFVPFALVAFITAYALAPDFGFPVPIYHGVHTCLHNLLQYCALYMDGLDAMPLCDTKVAGMESVGGKDQGGELGCIYTIAFLSVPEILLLRQTCKRFSALTRLWIVWTNAFKLDIVSKDFSFPLDDSDPQFSTCHAYRLASRGPPDSPLTPKIETSFIGSPVSKIKFLPGLQHKWLITISKGIWSVLTIWDIARGHKSSEWSPKRALLTEVKLNAEPWSEAGVAVLLSQRIVLLRLDDDRTLHEIHSVETDPRPRRHLQDGDLQLEDDPQHSYCLQVIFTPPTILAVRARSITLYDSAFTRIATHFFGWVDGASATPTSILVRSQSNNPWASELNSLELYSLSSFPPTLISKISSRRGALRCTDVILGKRGIAVWILRPSRYLHLKRELSDVPTYSSENAPLHVACETLVATVCPGPLNPTVEVRFYDACLNLLENWTVLDYDDNLGRVAVGSRESAGAGDEVDEEEEWQTYSPAASPTPTLHTSCIHFPPNSVLSPTYTFHTVQPASTGTFLTPYRSVVTRARSYVTVSGSFKLTTAIKWFLKFIVHYWVGCANDGEYILILCLSCLMAIVLHAGVDTYMYASTCIYPYQLLVLDETVWIFQMSELQTTEDDALAYIAPVNFPGRGARN
ncbi:hypothetical protein ARMGADRAFT_1086890 [Armillaria gallica]|uniref:F-box domain-containing protein n=1 Tax=Armillaria gallica TaxID=47427 RepID=A0A2H3DF91_ARMGA|nr:hypothetical protein ARMGADRAFT_1086890 [Armillaria gallica]